MGIGFIIVGLVVLNVVNAVDIWELGPKYHHTKECHGTNMGFSFSGSHEYHYESLQRRYEGCTHVTGNLEITNLNNGNVTYDLSFLSKIKVVTGYVLLGLLNVETIPLKKLRLIRADTTVKIGPHDYGLVVALTSEGTPTVDNPNPGLKQLQLPALREISRGKVMITQNPTLCYIDTIDWTQITKDDVKIKMNGNNATCSECHTDCEGTDGVKHCWGDGRHMCQEIHVVKNCPTECNGRCYGDRFIGCCHEQCAIGCWNSMETGCELCKYYRYKRRCVAECPHNTYSVGQDCVEF